MDEIFIKGQVIEVGQRFTCLRITKQIEPYKPAWLSTNAGTYIGKNVRTSCFSLYTLVGHFEIPVNTSEIAEEDKYGFRSVKKLKNYFDNLPSTNLKLCEGLKTMVTLETIAVNLKHCARS